MRPGVLSDPLRRLRGHVSGQDHGPPVPALIGCLIDIAVITSQVATAMNLQDELAQRNGRIAHVLRRLRSTS